MYTSSFASSANNPRAVTAFSPLGPNDELVVIGGQ